MYTVKMTLSIYQFDLFFIQTWYILKYWIIEKLTENVRSSHGPASTSFFMASSFHLIWMSCLNLISTSKYSSSKILTIKFYLYTFICTRKEPRRISTFCWHPIIMLIKLEKNPSSIHKWLFICSMFNAFHEVYFLYFLLILPVRIPRGSVYSLSVVPVRVIRGSVYWPTLSWSVLSLLGVDFCPIRGREVLFCL